MKGSLESSSCAPRCARAAGAATTSGSSSSICQLAPLPIANCGSTTIAASSAPAALAQRDAHELLASEPFIRYDRSVLGGQLADRYLRDHGIAVRQRLEMDGLMAVAALVGQGLGVALVPDWAPIWSSGFDIARIPLPGRAPVRRVGMVWVTHGPRAVLAQALLAEARAVCDAIRRGPAARPPRKAAAAGRAAKKR